LDRIVRRVPHLLVGLEKALPTAVWRQLRITAAVHDQTLDALLQRGALLVLEEFKNKRAP
jgi:hypothetical protein